MQIAEKVPLFEIVDFIIQWFRTKLREIVPNTDFFKPVIIKLKTFIHDSNNKIMCVFFCILVGNAPLPT